MKNALSSLFAAAVLTVLPMSAHAADQADAPKKPHEVIIPKSSISIDFPGGTIADLLAKVNQAQGGAFNLLGETEDLAMRLPAFSVRNVSPSSFAKGLSQLLEPKGIMIISEGADMYTLRRVNTLMPQQPAMFESFQIGPFLDKLSVDDIVAAVRTAWELNPANKPDALQLKFHPATKLLLASGSPDAIKVASKVIASLLNPDIARRQAVAEEVKKNREMREGGAAAPAKTNK